MADYTDRKRARDDSTDDYGDSKRYKVAEDKVRGLNPN